VPTTHVFLYFYTSQGQYTFYMQNMELPRAIRNCLTCHMGHAYRRLLTPDVDQLGGGKLDIWVLYTPPCFTFTRGRALVSLFWHERTI